MEQAAQSSLGCPPAGQGAPLDPCSIAPPSGHSLETAPKRFSFLLISPDLQASTSTASTQAGTTHHWPWDPRGVPFSGATLWTLPRKCNKMFVLSFTTPDLQASTSMLLPRWCTSPLAIGPTGTPVQWRHLVDTPWEMHQNIFPFFY